MPEEIKTNEQTNETLADSKKIDLYINNNEGDSEAGISIMNIFGYMKKRFHIFVFVILITLIIGLLVPVLMYEVKGNKEQAIAVLGLDYNGAEEGLAPDGKALDISYIKSSYIIQNALNSVKLHKEVSTALVQANLVITGVLTDGTKQKLEIIDKLEAAKSAEFAKLIQDFSLEYRAQYIISLDNEFIDGRKKITLSSSDLSHLLAAIVSAYNDYFNETYQDHKLPTNNMEAIDINTLDYLDVLDEVSTFLTSLESYCATKANVIPGFRASDGMSFVDLVDVIHTIKESDIDYIYSYIYLNNVSKNYSEQLANYKYQKRQANLELSEVNENIATTKNSIDHYQSDTIVISSADNNQTATVDVTSDYYNELVLSLTSLNERKSALEERITVLDNRITMLEGAPATEEQVAKAESYVASAISNANNIYNIVNNCSNELLSSNAYQNSYMHSIVTSEASSIKDSLKLFAIGAGAGLFIGVAIWAVDAFILEVRNNKREEKEEK